MSENASENASESASDHQHLPTHDGRVRPLREWRTQVEFESQREFAARVGVPAATLSFWETGRLCPRRRLHRLIAEKLHLEPRQLTFPAPRRPRRLAQVESPTGLGPPRAELGPA